MVAASGIGRVWIHNAEPGRNVILLEEFLEYDAELRAQLVVEGKAEFLDSMGYLMPLGEALEDLSEYWVRKPSADIPFSDDEVTSSGVRLRRTNDERRRYARMHFVRPIRVLREGASMDQVAISQDLSTGGLLFRTRNQYKVGDRIIAGWCSSKRGTGETWKRGTVVRSDRGNPRLATEFPRCAAIEFDSAAVDLRSAAMAT